MIAEKRDESGNFYYENYDKTSVNSLETNFGLEHNNINYELTYNFTRIRDEITYTRLPDVSEHMLNFRMNKKLKKYKTTVSGNMSYYGESLTKMEK